MPASRPQLIGQLVNMSGGTKNSGNKRRNLSNLNGKEVNPKSERRKKKAQTHFGNHTGTCNKRNYECNFRNKDQENERDKDLPNFSPNLQIRFKKLSNANNNEPNVTIGDQLSGNFFTQHYHALRGFIFPFSGRAREKPVEISSIFKNKPRLLDKKALDKLYVKYKDYPEFYNMIQKEKMSRRNSRLAGERPLSKRRSSNSHDKTDRGNGWEIFSSSDIDSEDSGSDTTDEENVTIRQKMTSKRKTTRVTSDLSSEPKPRRQGTLFNKTTSIFSANMRNSKKHFQADTFVENIENDSHFPDDSDYLLMIQELRHLQGYIWIKNKTLCNQTKKIGVFLFFVGIVGLICTVYFVECRVMINNLYGTFGMMILASILVFLVSRNEEAKLGSRSEFVKRKSLGY